MGGATKDEKDLQLPASMSPWMCDVDGVEPEVGNAPEYLLAIVRVIARKDVGEPLGEAERDACRTALALLGKDWK